MYVNFGGGCYGSCAAGVLLQLPVVVVLLFHLCLWSRLWCVR